MIKYTFITLFYQPKCLYIILFINQIRLSSNKLLTIIIIIINLLGVKRE